MYDYLYYACGGNDTGAGQLYSFDSSVQIAALEGHGICHVTSLTQKLAGEQQEF